MYIKYCSICIEKINKCGKNITLNDCNHIFHKKCLEKWVIQNNSCPNCRTEVNLIGNSYKIQCSKNINKNISCLKNNCNKDIFNDEIMPYLKFNIIIRLIIFGITFLLTCIVCFLAIGILNLVILRMFIEIDIDKFNRIFILLIGISETLILYLIIKGIKYYKYRNEIKNRYEVSI